MYSLEGQCAIVSGSASGIGRGIAKALLESGASVFLVDVEREKLQQTAEELGSLGKVSTYTADLRESGIAHKIVEAALNAYNRVDILVNSAGVYPSKLALTITEEDWEQVFDLNVKGLFFLSQAVAGSMVETGTQGRIVNITSTASEVARPGVAHYCASKAAVKMMTQVLALEWAEFGIRVNALGPGLVETESLTKTLITAKARDEHQEKLSYCPLQRAALIEEIAAGVLFFASEQSSFVTGQSLLVDGGYSAGRVFSSMQDKKNT
jgi:NAD(P)-dependent dehydrogenase (short-subunit alcohol dehydrogenase family)